MKNPMEESSSLSTPGLLLGYVKIVIGELIQCFDNILEQ